MTDEAPINIPLNSIISFRYPKRSGADIDWSEEVIKLGAGVPIELMTADW